MAGFANSRGLGTNAGRSSVGSRFCIFMLLLCGLVVSGAAPSVANLANGRYCIQNSNAKTFLYDQLSMSGSCGAGEHWDVYTAPQTGGFYCLRAARGGQHLSYTGDTAFFQGPCNGDTEYWELIDEGDGTYCIRNTREEHFLSDSFPTLHGRCGAGERWRFTQLKSNQLSGSAKTFEPGFYCLKNANGQFLAAVTADASPRAVGGCGDEAVWRIYLPWRGPVLAKGKDSQRFPVDPRQRHCIESSQRLDYLMHRAKTGAVTFGSTCFNGQALWQFLDQGNGTFCILSDDPIESGTKAFLSADPERLAPNCGAAERWNVEEHTPVFTPITGAMVAFFGGIDKCEDAMLGKNQRTKSRWKRYGPLEGRLALGTIHPKFVGDARGPKIGNLATLGSHKHAFRADVDLPPSYLAASNGGGAELADSGPITVRGWTNGTGAIPNMQLLPCQEINPSISKAAESLPPQSVAFFNARSCPVDWLPFKELHGRFIVSGKQGTDGKSLDLVEGKAVRGGSIFGTETPDLSHDHGIEVGPKTNVDHRIELDFQSVSVGLAGGSNPRAGVGYAAVSGVITATQRPDGRSHVTAPYAVLLACRKNAGKFIPQQVPGGMTTFTAAKSCDKQMPTLTFSQGYYISGLPNDVALENGVSHGGSLTANRELSHAHDVKVEVTVRQSNVVEFLGNSRGFVDPRKSYWTSGKTGPSGYLPPFVQLEHCWRSITPVGRWRKL